MIIARSYKPVDREHWDALVDGSKNGTFMLKRDYVEYHSDRFEDASVVFEDEMGDIVAVMPASRHCEEIRSHGGLTYGGIVCDRRMTQVVMMHIIEALRGYLCRIGAKKLLYKRVPAIYYNYPADEDLYALFRFGARLVRRDVSTAIDLSDRIPFSSIRMRMVRKAEKNGLVVRESFDYSSYVTMLANVLQRRHAVKPVHNDVELRLLASRFPDVIHLYCAYQGEKMMAGVLVFDTPRVIHAQYIANSEDGRNIGALDLVMQHLIATNEDTGKYFDFGVSTENGGMILNEGLVRQKEMFGGRAVVYDFYELEV